MNNPSDKTILIVNDSPDQRELLKVIFEQAGYVASTASDGREGFNMAKTAQFDLIISDVIMPDGDGIELCLWIRADEELRSLPILLVSGLRKDVSDVIEGLEGVADDYLELPADPLHLIARAERLIERKRLEDLIRQNENHFRSLIENAPDVISVILPDGTILYQSPSLEQVLGFKPEQVIGENIFDLIHNDDKARVADFFENKMKTLVSTQPIEYRFRNSGGEWMILESVGKFINDPSKGSVAIINSRDITERRQAEEKLREKEQWMRAILDGSRDGIVIEDGAEIAYINQSYTHLLGYDSPDELVGKRSSVLLPPDEAERLAEYGKRRRRGENAPAIYEFKGKHKNGSLIESEGSVSASFIGGKKYIMTAIRDITARKLAESVLEQSERDYRTIFEQAHDAIMIFAPERETILDANGRACELYGFSRAEFIGMSIETISKIPGHGKEKVMETLELGENLNFETIQFRKDGSEMVLEVNASTIIYKGQLAIITINRDITERRLTEKALRESEARLQAIFDDSAIGIALSNIEGFPIHSNPALQQMLGYTGRELQQMSFIEFTHPIDVAKTSVFMQEIQQGTRNYYQIEKRYIKKSGEEVWSSVTVSTIPKDSGEPQFILSMIEDITNRKLAEQNIVFQAQLLNTVEQAVIATDLDGTVNYWNQFANKLYGWSAEEAVGRSVIELTTPEIFREKGIEIMERLGTGKSWSGEFMVQNKDADIFPAQVFNTPINDDKGKLTGIVGISIDITERKQAEQGLRESEENFRALVLATAQHVWTIKENDANEDISKWWMNLTGLTFEKLQVADWLEPIHPEDREIAESVWQNEFTNKILFNTSYRVRIKTGEYRHYAVRGVPVFNSDGSFRQWIGTFDDITEHKQIEQALLKSEEQLRQSQKLESVGRLAGGIAHDFNNMLTAINGYSDLTLRKLEADNPLRHNIEEIKKAGERSALLTRQLLAFSRRQVLQSSVLDLNEVIADTTKLLERLIGEDVRLETILGANLRHVTADPGQLTQVIMNLAVNARDAMPKGGNLIIETANVFLDEEYAARHVPTKPGSYIMLAVTDTGSGMNAETLKNIFEPFYTTKEMGKGTGLGLATVYGIVKQSEGFIWVESEIGAGSTFKIYLPCIDSEPDLRDKDDASEHTAHKAATILIVEDEDLVRALTRQALEECGYTIIEAGNGSQALAMCRQSDCAIDLVITDVVMPEMGGRELAEKLAETCPQMPVLFTSGYTDDAAIRSDVIEADTNFIQKPFTFESLTNKVKQFLNKKTAIE